LARFTPPAADTPAPAVQSIETPPPDSVVSELAARAADVRQHIAVRGTDPRWRDQWVGRLNDPEGWRVPLNIARYCVEDFLDPFAAAGDAEQFAKWEQYIREFIVEGTGWEQRALPPEHRAPEIQSNGA
jgi:hypothetical protein